jgi:nucleoside-diphosphate-sugar epimerase
MDDKFQKMLVNPSNTIREVMRAIDLSGFGMALIVDNENKLLGLVTDGNIRRAILNGIDINANITSIMNKSPITVKDTSSNEEIIALMITKNVFGKIPVLDENNHVVDLVISPIAAYGKGVKDYALTHADKLIFLNKEKEKQLIRNVKKVLLIGGAGYLGSVLSRKLLEKNYQVKVFDKLIFGIEPIEELLKNKNFEFIKGDICNISEVSHALDDVDAVIHLAGIVGDPASSVNPRKTIEVNYIATKIVAELCKYNQINRFIFASSCSVYGSNSELINEDSALNPISLYAKSKIASEKSILELIDDNFSPVIMRMGTLYGVSPRMRFDLVLNLLPAKAIIDKSITIFNGDQWRPFLHINDAAEAYIKVLEAPIENIRGNIFNIGGNENNFKLREIGYLIKELIPDAKLNFDEKVNDPRDYRVNFDKAENILNFKAIKTVKEGISEVVNIVQEKSISHINNQSYNNYLRELIE